MHEHFGGRVFFVNIERDCVKTCAMPPPPYIHAGITLLAHVQQHTTGSVSLSYRVNQTNQNALLSAILYL